MTTLHGLVTISELFAGFNNINTGVVNCVIMCQNVYAKRTISRQKIQKNSGITPPVTPPHWVGEGNTPL